LTPDHGSSYPETLRTIDRVLSEGLVPKILGVDDSVTMRRVLQMSFAGDAGNSLTTLGSGEEALRWCREHAPDVVLADASMDEMDGYDIARALKGDAATANIRVVVMASQHHPYDVDEGREAGVDDHVVKPFETQALRDKVKAVWMRVVEAGPVASGPPTPTATASTSASALIGRSTLAFGAPLSHRPPTEPPPASSDLFETGDVGPDELALELLDDDGAPPAAAPEPWSASSLPPEPAGASDELAPVAAAMTVPPDAVTFDSGSPSWMAPAPESMPPMSIAPDAVSMVADSMPAPAPSSTAPATHAAAVATEAMAGRLSGMGLTEAQVEGVLALSREVIERVVWEVVPDLAETIIREELRRLTGR
jgi:CheY-like chemotaxis protein